MEALYHKQYESAKLMFNEGAEVPLGKAIFVQVSTCPNGLSVYDKSGNMTRVLVDHYLHRFNLLRPGNYRVKVAHRSSTVTTETSGETITLKFNAARGHVYSIHPEMYRGLRKWTAWIEEYIGVEK